MAVIDVPVMTELAARTETATKIYGSGDTQVTALDGVDVAYESLCGACYLDESGESLASGWKAPVGLELEPDPDFS